VNTTNLHSPRWTAAEDSIVRAMAPTREACELYPLLPGRSIVAIRHRVRHLGIAKRRRWTRSDDLRLADLWGRDLEEVARTIGRSMLATYERARVLGLGLGVPAGAELLTASARRCGYAVCQLRRILRWAQVRIHDSVARKKTGRPHHWVEPIDVDEAVAKWLKRDEPKQNKAA
jgi:hypothetical protein